MKQFFIKLGSWLDDRTGLTSLIKPLAHHKVPPGTGWAYVFGSATLFCFLLQVVTGVGLALLYQPTTSEAYESLQYITHEAPLGHFLRSLHYMGASGMIVLIGLHMIRVYLTAAYKYPREMNWVSGVILFILTVVMGFTGQVLRWDSNGLWSTLVGAEQISRFPLIGAPLAYFLFGGKTIGAPTLMRFFNYHVFLTPALLFGVIGFHLYLVVRNGISEPTRRGRVIARENYREWYSTLLKKKGVPFWPDAGWRDAVAGSGLILLLLLLAYLIGAPELTGPPDPTQIHVKPHPDWFLLWPEALYALMPPALESYVMFLLPLVLFGLLFSVPFLSLGRERSPLKRPWALVGVVMTLLSIGSLTYLGVKAPWAPEFNTPPLTKQELRGFSPEMKKGYHLFYEKGCQYCHQMQGKGGTRGPNLSEVGGRLTSDQLSVRIVNGGHGMPAYGSSLTRQELSTLVLFLQRMKPVLSNGSQAPAPSH